MLEQNSNYQVSINKTNKLLYDSANKKTTFTNIINETDVEGLKRKINSITQYQKPYISKLFYEVLSKNPENAKILCDYIAAEQNEFNIKESTKEDKIKHMEIILGCILGIDDIHINLKNSMETLKCIRVWIKYWIVIVNIPSTVSVFFN